jgi:hypothetical protein
VNWTHAVFGALALCAACDSKSSGAAQGSGSGSATGKQSPCALLTKEEVGQVMGMVIPEPTVDGSDCKYIAANATNGSAMVTATWEKTEAEAKADYGATTGAMAVGGQLTKGLMPDAPGAIAGLGDEASFAMYFLHVRKGSALFQISVNLPNRMIDMMKQSQGGPEKYAALVLEMDKTLAAKALPRL